jgi:single-strand DNA-binding protein
MKTNHVLLIGYVGKEVEIKETENSCKRVSIRMATHYLQKNETGEKKFNTVWHDIVAWNEKAEYAERSFVKGSKIMVDGSIQYRKYADRSGHMRYIVQIKAHSLINLDR